MKNTNVNYLVPLRQMPLYFPMMDQESSCHWLYHRRNYFHDGNTIKNPKKLIKKKHFTCQIKVTLTIELVVLLS